MTRPAAHNGPGARSRTLIASAVFGLFLVAAWFFTREKEQIAPPPPSLPVSPETAPALAVPSGRLSAVVPPALPFAEDELERDRKDRQQEAVERLARYRLFARYPPSSRPAKEHPDQMTPFLPVVRSSALLWNGQPNDEIRVQLGQDRRELVEKEAAKLWLRCEDSLGKVLPCRVEKSKALPAPPSDSPLTPVPLPFLDTGQQGDERASDGTYTAMLQPSELGMARYHGPVRVEVQLALGEQRAPAFFDLVYTPTAPARFVPPVRENMEQGSLLLSVPMQVVRPGRYFVLGRVDDSQGKQVAYLEWNGELAAGERSVPLLLFGKLVHDERPLFPLFLRDVEGFLLLEDQAPDRLHMPALEGPVHKTRVYSSSDFSVEEWDSEMKRRYLEEFEKEARDSHP